MQIYYCPKCGIYHLAERWEENTASQSAMTLDYYGIYYCPSCSEVSHYEEISFPQLNF